MQPINKKNIVLETKVFRQPLMRLFILLLIINLSNSDVISQRAEYNFNHGWKLYVGDPPEASEKQFDDAEWKEIALPYAWNQEEAFKKDIRDLSTGIAWYRKSFRLPEGAMPGKIFLEFEGVRHMGEVFINGQFIGRHENGVMAFGFDITPFLEAYPGENVVAVRTDNDWCYKEKLTGSGFQWNDRNFNANYGGIPKNVFLHRTPEVYQTLPLYSTMGTTGTYVYATDLDIKGKQALVHVETQVRNESLQPVDVHLAIRVKDMDGQLVASFPGEAATLSPGGMVELHASDTIQNLHFWSWGYGYLYTVYSELLIDGKVADKVETRTGFRKTGFENGMITLNDRVIMVKGYAQRTSNEWPAIGMSAPPWLSDYSNRLMVEGNGNLVRWMHVTPWKQDVESCDRVGLIQTMPAGDAEGDVRGRRWEHRTALMRDAIIYNRNQDSHAIENVIRWFDFWEMRPGTGKRVSSGGVNIIFSDSNTHHRGAENYRRSGEVDPMRIKKENYYAHKVIWDGWVDPDTARIHIIGHWNYDAGTVKNMTVISTAEKVELLVNNQSLGWGTQSHRFLYTFKDVAFQPGTITAVGYDNQGNSVCETSIKTTGKPAALKLTTIQGPGGMLANGRDLAIVQVEVVDSQGNRCPTAMNMIRFEVKGAGEFLSGIAQGPDNYIGNPSLPVECGVNRLFIRSGTKPGKIKIKANSEGLEKAVLSMETVQADTRTLSETIPGNGLPSYMEMGPTPASPSYKVTRRPVEIITATAASNQDDVAMSYDDNEMTEWRNNDLLSGGIIEYELERKAVINQAVIKFSGWRRRSYPITISVDDTEVFRGDSPKSLGYVTFNFNPTEGRKVRVELTGATRDSDAFNIVEITGEVDQAGAEQETAAKGSLRLIEVEFYGQ